MIIIDLLLKCSRHQTPIPFKFISIVLIKKKKNSSLYFLSSTKKNLKNLRILFKDYT